MYLYVQSESGGTVLSTNWDEIAKQKTECKPPDVNRYSLFTIIVLEFFYFQGMEWKSYDT